MQLFFLGFLCQPVKFFKRNGAFLGELSYGGQGGKIHAKDFISDPDVVCFRSTQPAVVSAKKSRAAVRKRLNQPAYFAIAVHAPGPAS